LKSKPFAICCSRLRSRRGLGEPETFNFLGFTFICGKTRAGKFQIKRKTRADRMRAKLKRRIKEEMWRRMHQPIPEQGKWLWYVVNGCDAAIPSQTEDSGHAASIGSGSIRR
jgi:hypothetical protein